MKTLLHPDYWVEIPDNSLGGIIDEVYIYNWALTETEIQRYYRVESP